MKIIIIGAPGSGKGTLSEYLIEKYNFSHLSTGNLFRKSIEDKTETADELKKYLSSGELVPDELTNKVVKNTIQTLEKEKKSFVLDGYPRNISQANFLNHIVDVDKVIYLNVDNDIIIKRLTGRRICLSNNKIYNIYFSPPKVDGICDITGEPLVQRKDDDVEIIKKRLETYKENTFPLVAFYKQTNKLVEIDGSLSKDAIHKIIDSIIG